MSSVKIELNTANIGALLKSNEMQNLLQNEANRIQSSLGSQYSTDTKLMSTRVIASVYTTDKDAIEDNLNNDSMIKAMK